MRKDVDCRTTISQIENILAGIGLTYSIIERENNKEMFFSVRIELADDPRNLYSTPLFYDSEQPEHEILKISPPPKITVFGKIPRRAIKVPTYTGGSTTPDFVYVVETDKNNYLYVLLETKAQDMRGAEKRAVESQERLFATVQNVQWHLITDADEVSSLLNSF